MIFDQLNLLTTVELTILEQHLKLGVAHLKKLLNDIELKRLLHSLSSNSPKISKIGQSTAEISGSLLLALNFVFSAVFGAWVGYSGFLGFNLDSVWIFWSLITLAAASSVVIGYYDVKVTKQKASEAMNNQKLKLLQLEILKKIEQKKRDEVHTIILSLNSFSVDLALEVPFKEGVFDLNKVGEAKAEAFEWLEKVEALGKEKLAARLSDNDLKEWTEEWNCVNKELKQNVFSFFSEQSDSEHIHSQAQKKDEKFLDSFVIKLVSTLPKKTAPLPIWSSKNIRSLMVGLIPTVLGGFSSLLVYFKTVPEFLKNLGYMNAFHFFANPKVKVTEFIISFAFTLYFGISFIHKHRNSVKRDQELEKTHKSIIQMESSLTVLDANIVKLKEAKKNFTQLRRVCKMLDKMPEYLSLES